MKMLTKKGLRIKIWDMLPEDCKEIMKPIRKSYLDSIMADIESYAIFEQIKFSSTIKLLYVTKPKKEFQRMADELHNFITEKLNKK